MRAAKGRRRPGSLRVRPAGEQALRAARNADGGHYPWYGNPPPRTLLVEWPADQMAPTGGRPLSST
ncbi:hypothetical protein [Streptomyces sp. NPDC005799]|uniref:hypothetical protein n=1 Tax=Streptomyces sp. NPDC005799 TaxID=3154678 RepID=UPI0033D8CEC6